MRRSRKREWAAKNCWRRTAPSRTAANTGHRASRCTIPAASPVLIVHADGDRDCPIDMAQAVFGKLLSAPYRRWVEIGEGTHSVFLEKNRWQVFCAVDGFLAENPNMADGSPK
jgi:pimeloyl-ACP methyl ester carboxylesterase